MARGHQRAAGHQPVATLATETGLTRLGGLTISQSTGMLGCYSYQTDASRYTVENLSLLQNPRWPTPRPAGWWSLRRWPISTPALSTAPVSTSTWTRPRPTTRARRRTCAGSSSSGPRPEGDQPPDLNPDPALSWGRFPFPMDRLAAFNDYVAGISFDVNHSKVYVLQVPTTGQPPSTAPKAVMFAVPAPGWG